MIILGDKISFPPVSHCEKDGLLAIGGDLSPARLIAAYRQGIFPWYEGEHILWWSPDPRFILNPSGIHVSKSMLSLINRNIFEFTTNKAFAEVIRACKKIERHDQDGTWITDEMEKAYIRLHEMGIAHSAETWQQGELVGGVYGIKMGKVFFGESMFSKKSNASKFALISYARMLDKEGVKLIDCQVYTQHLESLGAIMIPRKEFINQLKDLLPPP